MLPWRVVFANLVTSFREDASFRNRMVGFVVVMTLLIGAFTTGFEAQIRFGSSDGSALLAGGDAAGGAAAGTGRGSTAATTGGTATGPGAGSSEPGTGGTAAAGGAGDGTGAGVPGEAPPTSGPGQGGAQGAGAPSCEGAALRATDNGVTEDSITVGFLAAELGQLSQAGFAAGVAADYELIMQAWANELNANGGVSCREVRYVIEHFDVLSVDDMLAKCRRMTQDHKVAAVVTTGGYDSVAQLCITRDNQTPLLNTEPQPDHWYQEAAPYLWATLMSKDRTHRNHVRWLVEAGEITPASKIGVVYHGIPNVGPAVERSLLPELKRHGIEPVRVAKLSADSEQALSQISQVVIDFQSRGVEFVFMPMNLIFKTQFMQQAEQQNYLPDYTDSDHYYGCFDFVTGTYPGRSWDGTKCVTASLAVGVTEPDLRAYADSHPFQQYADRVYQQTHPDGYATGGRDQDEADAQRAMHSTAGTLLLLWAEAANRVGPDYTRAAWGREMGNTGAFDKHVSPEPLTFRPDKWDGPDHIQVLEWRNAASDGYEERRYRRIVAPRPAFY